MRPTLRLARASQAQRVGVLVCAGELVLLGAVLGEGAHQPALVVGVLEPVEEHVVLRLGMAEPRAAAHLRQQVRGVRHAFHAARDHHPRRAGEQRVMGEHHGLHARAAHLVERGRRDAFGQAGAEARLPGRGLPLAGRKHAAHEQFVHLGGRQPARSSAAAIATPPSPSRETGERALEAAHRRAGRAC